MDFSAIWAEIQAQEWFSIAVELVQGIVVCASAIKAYLVFRNSKTNANTVLQNNTENLNNLGTNLTNIVKNALPSSMKVDVSNLIDKRVEDALSDIKAEIMTSVTNKLSVVCEKEDWIVRALGCLKSIPDSLKDEGATLLSPAPVETSITVPLIVSQVEETEKVKEAVIVPIE